MKKLVSVKVLIVILSVLVLMFAGCTKVTTPNITGTWTITTPDGVIEVCLVLEGLNFADLSGQLGNGAITRTGTIAFSYGAYSYGTNWYFGNTTSDTMVGFVRQGPSGPVIGAWSGTKH